MFFFAFKRNPVPLKGECLAEAAKLSARHVLMGVRGFNPSGRSNCTWGKGKGKKMQNEGSQLNDETRSTREAMGRVTDCSELASASCAPHPSGSDRGKRWPACVPTC